MAACLPRAGCGGPGAGGDVLGSWAEHLAGRARNDARGCLRFAFYGRVSTEDWQDPVTSRARQLQMQPMCSVGLQVHLFRDRANLNRQSGRLQSPRPAGDAPRRMDRDGRLHRDRPGSHDPADHGSRRRAALTPG